MSLLIASFLGGILTVFTPCVFLLLPVILAGNIAEKSLRNQIVTILSLIFFIFLTTIILKFSSIFLYVGEDVWKNLSAALIIFLGFIYIFPSIWSNKYFGAKFGGLGNRLNSIANSFSRDSLWKPILIGFALSPIFASCSPIYFLLLASVLPVNFGLGVVYILSYCVGIGLTLLIVANIGQSLLLKINQKIVENMKFKIGVGVLFIVVGALIYTGLDKKLEESIPTPEVVKNLDKQILENETVISEKKQIIEEAKVAQPKVMQKEVEATPKVEPRIVLENLGTAPELVGISDYINVEPGTKLYDILKRNKVVLFEFWTYSCINCKRTIPYLNSWYDKYHDKGFEIVGVHTPEFAFEKVRANVVKNSEAQGVKFPIFMDNGYETWNAYNNRYWPMRFLMLPNGQIIYQHAGEGDYENNEKLIKYIVENT